MMCEYFNIRRIMRHYLLVAVVLIVLPGCGTDTPQLPPLSGDAVILAFGNSLTHGTGAPGEASYPFVLEQLSARTVINAGVPGEVSAQGLKRLPDLLDQHSPDLLILCHGGNDILRKKNMADMQNNLRTMIAAARERDIPVLMLAVPKFGLFPSAAPEYREVAESTGVLFIEDLVPEILRDKSLKSDTVHPNADGYGVMARAIHRKLQAAGAL